MVLRDRSTMTERSLPLTRGICGLTLHEGLTFVGSLLLPLMLGVFTIVITFHQHSVAIEQRREDREIAREQREQDLNISREQRQQDLLMFALQREQDLNISREQRKQDKEIAENQRIQHSELAEKQRSLADVQRAHELQITQEHLRDTILGAYMNDISTLLKDNQGNLTADPTTAIIARAKTMNALRQLDIARKTRVVQFLYQAKQLTTGDSPLDLSDADLSGINLTDNHIVGNSYRYLRNLSLAGVVLRNSSFEHADLNNANFSGADISYARFWNCRLFDVDMSNATIVRVDFTRSSFIRTRFDHAHLRRISFMTLNLTDATFVGTNIESVTFIKCICKKVNFTEAHVEKSDFAEAYLHQTVFSGANLRRANFSNARLTDSNFGGAILEYANFSKSICHNTNFAKSKLVGAQFVDVILKDFDFMGFDIRGVDFSGADLTVAALSHAILDNAKFNRTIVVMADFSSASMKKALISDDQLLAALSIRGTTLPNGTVIKRDSNVLYNGHANCNRTASNNSWQVYPPGTIDISPTPNSPDDCVFKNQDNITSFMSQELDLINYLPLISRHRALFVLKVHRARNISSIRLMSFKDKVISAINSTQNFNSIMLRGQLRNQNYVVTVEFSAYGWCDDIELTLEMATRTAWQLT